MGERKMPLYLKIIIEWMEKMHKEDAEQFFVFFNDLRADFPEFKKFIDNKLEDTGRQMGITPLHGFPRRYKLKPDLRIIQGGGNTIPINRKVTYHTPRSL